MYSQQAPGTSRKVEGCARLARGRWQKLEGLNYHPQHPEQECPQSLNKSWGYCDLLTQQQADPLLDCSWANYDTHTEKIQKMHEKVWGLRTVLARVLLAMSFHFTHIIQGSTFSSLHPPVPLPPLKVHQLYLLSVMFSVKEWCTFQGL